MASESSSVSTNVELRKVIRAIVLPDTSGTVQTYNIAPKGALDFVDSNNKYIAITFSNVNNQVYCYGDSSISVSVDDSRITTSLNDGGVTTTKIADGAITHDKIGSGAVHSDNIADGAVGAEQLAFDVYSCSETDNLLDETEEALNKRITEAVNAKLSTYVVSILSDDFLGFGSQAEPLTISLASGKTYTDSNGTAFTGATLHVGDVFLVEETNMPDRWVKSITATSSGYDVVFSKLETVLPTSLRNPNAISGASGSYDGSAAKKLSFAGTAATLKPTASYTPEGTVSSGVSQTSVTASRLSSAGSVSAGSAASFSASYDSSSASLTLSFTANKPTTVTLPSFASVEASKVTVGTASFKGTAATINSSVTYTPAGNVNIG